MVDGGNDGNGVNGGLDVARVPSNYLFYFVLIVFLLNFVKEKFPHLAHIVYFASLVITCSLKIKNVAYFASLDF